MGEFRFEGFRNPHYTQVPDEYFDVLMPILKEGEFKVLGYVIRRTFGFKKDADAISISQMASGITTRDGRSLDAGTGLSKSSVKTAVASLVEKGILVAERMTDEHGGDAATVYRLRFVDES